MGSRIFSKKFRIFPKYLFSLEMKIKLKSTLYLEICFVLKLIWSRNRFWNKTNTFHKTTCSTIILIRSAKVFEQNFSFSREGANLFRINFVPSFSIINSYYNQPDFLNFINNGSTKIYSFKWKHKRIKKIEFLCTRNL